MRKYSPLLGLMIIVTGMMILQMGNQEVSRSTASTTLQFNQIDQGSGELYSKPDLKTLDWSGIKSVDDQDSKGAAAVMLAEADEEGHGSEAGEEEPTGGFDRLWDVVSNG